ncbi:MAG: cytochrome b5 domain-containing protein [Sporolactobacillus sp.]
MFVKKGMAYLLIITALLLAGCTHAVTQNRGKATHSVAITDHLNPKKSFTLAQLSTYNGKNGRPAYIAVKGKVYNVTHAPDWHNGHHRGVQAGQDLTAAIEHAPHGTSVLSAVPIVGNLVGSKTAESTGLTSSRVAGNFQKPPQKQKKHHLLTLAELKKYNGQNGQPAYVAVSGKVYDVTHAPDWHNGYHHGVQAGQDLTQAIKHAPHGTSVLSQLKVVGYLTK